MAKVLINPAHLTRNKGCPCYCHCQAQAHQGPGQRPHTPKKGLCETKPQPSSRANNQNNKVTSPCSCDETLSCHALFMSVRENSKPGRSLDCCLAMRLELKVCRAAGQSWSFLPQSQTSDGGSRYGHVHIPVSVNGVWVPGHWVRENPEVQTKNL